MALSSSEYRNHIFRVSFHVPSWNKNYNHYHHHVFSQSDLVALKLAKSGCSLMCYPITRLSSSCLKQIDLSIHSLLFIYMTCVIFSADICLQRICISRMCAFRCKYEDMSEVCRERTLKNVNLYLSNVNCLHIVICGFLLILEEWTPEASYRFQANVEDLLFYCVLMTKTAVINVLKSYQIFFQK